MINVIDYVRLGYKIIPLYSCVNGICTCYEGKNCKQAGKHPYSPFVPGGARNATASEKTVALWLAKASSQSVKLNWGLVMGAGTFALDVDPRNGGDESFKKIQEQHGTLETPMYADTGGGGVHLVFKSNHKIVKKSKPWDGIDLIGSGSYIVVEPSEHRSGRKYAWRGPIPAATDVVLAPPFVLGKTQKGYEALQDDAPWDGVDASETPMGKLLASHGLLGHSLGQGKRTVCCPWVSEHSDGRGDGKDDSTVLFAKGKFHCSHGHCTDRKDADVFAKLKPTEAGIELLYENTKKGPKLVKNSVNLARIIQTLYQGQVADNRILGGLVEWKDDRWVRFTDGSFFNCKVLVCEKYGLDFPEPEVRSALRAFTEKTRIDPVRDYLKGLQWDGISRLDNWLSNYLESPDSSFSRKVGAWWMISAVARALRPGCQADHVLILEGKQGVGKSSCLRILGGAWFSDQPLEFSGSADTSMLLQRGWIFELGELDSLAKSRISEAKAFFSKAWDTFRKPYGTENMDHPRHCVFAGSVNHSEYLPDDTGNRRYWPVKVLRVHFRALEHDRDQLWAEAVVRFHRGDVWYPTTQGEVELMSEEQCLREMPCDPWEEKIRAYMDVHVGELVTISYLLTHVVGVDVSISPQSVTKRVSCILARIGCEKVRPSSKKNRIMQYMCK